jgi:hypothetical protein
LAPFRHKCHFLPTNMLESACLVLTLESVGKILDVFFGCGWTVDSVIQCRIKKGAASTLYMVNNLSIGNILPQMSCFTH